MTVVEPGSRPARAPQWNVKGVDEETRAIARDAAAAAGLPIGAWIDRAVKRAAAAQPEVAPAPVPAPTEPELSLAEPVRETPVDPVPDEAVAIDPPTDEMPAAEPQAADAPPIDPAPAEAADAEPLADETPAIGPQEAEAPQVGPAPDMPPDRVPPSAARGGVGRGARIVFAVAILAVLAGGAAWLVRDNAQPPTSDKTAATPQTASESAGTTAPSGDAVQQVSAPSNTAPAPEDAALEALRQAAQAGDPRAQYDLAVRYASGLDIAKDEVQAARWFERAAVQGLAPAQYNLGVMYDRGLGLTEDPARAFFWYQSAADQGHGRAQHNLATAFAEGKGTTQDMASAAKWFEKAAAAGLPESQYYLGAMYERGIGVSRDATKALELYRLAADQGHKEAAARLAVLASLAPTSNATTDVRMEDFATAAGEAAVPRATVAEIQRLLSRLDFDPGRADGVVGRKTQDAISKYQAMAGMTVDGKPSAALLEDLREVAGAAKR